MNMEIRKTLIALMTAVFATVSGAAFAAGTPGDTVQPQQGQVDCKKTPDHPECKKR